jgi:integrase
MGRLNKTEIDKLLGKPQSRKLELVDGNNLYLIVTKIGSCKFKYRIRTPDKASWVVIGDYPDVTLNEARHKALEIRAMISQGIDPNLAKLKEKSKNITLRELVERYFVERMPIVRTKEKSRQHFVSSVKRDITDIIGDMKLLDVTDEIIKQQLLNPKIANGSPSVARGIRNNIKVIFDFAIELGLITFNPTTMIKASNIYRDKPRSRHLTMSEIAKLLQLVYQAQIKTQHKLAFHLSLMVLTRKTELIHATWDCVDFDSKRFTIKMSKMDTQLVIPLPIQAISILEILKELSQGSKYIFTGRSGIDEPISTTTLNWISKPINNVMFGDNKAEYFTIHDLRRTGATQLGEMGYPSDYIEVALNHGKAGIKQVYQRSQYIDQRKEMLQVWADKLDELIGDDKLLPYGKRFII